MRANTASMANRSRRTYNLSSDAIAHVRDLAARGDIATSQDGIVELAIEQLYREVRDREEAALWALASQDAAFRVEMRALDSELGEPDEWRSE
jgi:hypothetical protein